MKPIIVPGFKAAGIHSGIKKRKKKDLALIFSEVKVRAAGLFTTNHVKAAPVVLDIKKIRSGKGQAIVANSGNANACSGRKGFSDALEMAKITAKALEVPEEMVYVASTGVIGRYLPMDKVRKGIVKATPLLSKTGLHDAAEAIMTTDTFPKIASQKAEIGGKIVTIAGIAKGAGMIHPKLAMNSVSGMATMLCFILTDAKVEGKALNTALKASVEKSFNSITIDGDTSTNDSVICFANGLAGNREIKLGSREFSKFQKVLDRVTSSLARMIVLDGEGATKLIEIIVKGASTEDKAKNVAFRVANSNLVKTAMNGEDPNWGRIMAAIGSSGVGVKPERINISFGNLRVVEKGLGLGRDKEAKRILKKREIKVTIQLGKGKAQANVLTTDLSTEYVKINATYLT
jgi:glutamate N-acetyltransferase/amino-acid N-acetyltransferase